MKVVMPCFEPEPLEPDPADGLWPPDDFGAAAPPKNGICDPPDCPTDGVDGAFEPDGVEPPLTGDFLPASGGAVMVDPPLVRPPLLTEGVGMIDRPGVEIVGPPLPPGVPLLEPPETDGFGVEGSLDPLGNPEPDEEPEGGLIVALPELADGGLPVIDFGDETAGGDDLGGLVLLGFADDPLLREGNWKPERPELLDDPGL